jgi:hypothetical protein
MLYGFNILIQNNIDNKLEHIKCDNLIQLNETIELYNNLDTPIIFQNEIYSYGICLLNKWCENNTIEIKYDSKASKINDSIKNNTFDSIEYQQKLSLIVRKILWIMMVNQKEALTLPFDEVCQLLETQKKDNIYNLIQKMPSNPYIGYQIHKSLIEKTLDEIPSDYQLYKLTKSKFKQSQFARSLVSVGY